MSYAVELDPQAIDDLSGLPPVVQRLIVELLRNIAESPSRNSRPATVPYPPGMLHRADIPLADMQCLVDVVFRYSQDEQSIHIDRIFSEFA